MLEQYHTRLFNDEDVTYHLEYRVQNYLNAEWIQGYKLHGVEFTSDSQVEARHFALVTTQRMTPEEHRHARINARIAQKESEDTTQ